MIEPLGDDGHVDVGRFRFEIPRAFAQGGDMLVTERAGRLRVIRNVGGKAVLDPAPLGGLPEIRAVSLGGLLDIAPHPSFAQNRWIYFTYSKPGAEDPAHATTAVGRARWDGGATLSDVKDVFVADAKGNPTGQERMLTELKQRFRDTRVGPDGFIYLLTDETFGAVLRMEPGQ